MTLILIVIEDDLTPEEDRLDRLFGLGLRPSDLGLRDDEDDDDDAGED